ncbi:hypothetical protein HMPREF1548_03479 [Clostridium sp. KLE 1755]|nr:hypothetical protein HMPREF1548_03479 [Clostridium sp. KLE 1755]
MRDGEGMYMRIVLLSGQVWQKNKKPKQSAFWLLIIIMILSGQYCPVQSIA